jgi:GH15 family glucan-1,4-alpha-glucosidase
MKKIIVLLFVICCSIIYGQNTVIKQSYFKLSTANGLLSAVYDSKKNVVEYVYPHIFLNRDSATLVRPFVGNIKLKDSEQPISVFYQNNTHVITAKYNKFEVSYLTSFTNQSKVFYVVAKGKKQDIENLTFSSETEAGSKISGVSLLQHPSPDLSVPIAGSVLMGSVMRKYDKTNYEKYFLFSFTDDLHTDKNIVSKAIADLSKAKSSLVDDEIGFMKNIFKKCFIPKNLPENVRNTVEQNISYLKMAQVSDKEIIPNSQGQIIAALRPGPWNSTWVRDGSYAIEAMTHLGLFDEAKKGLEFMLKGKANKYKKYKYTDGKTYGVGMDYQLSVCRYFGNGEEDSTFGNEIENSPLGAGPNIEFDNFGLFLTAFSDYVKVSNDVAFYKKWNDIVTYKIADPTVFCIDKNGLMKEDSGPWEHYLQNPKQYTFTSGVCAKGLQEFAELQKKFNLPFSKYEQASETIKQGLMKNILIDNRYFKGNEKDQKTDYEYYDSGAFEIFANGLITDKKLFLSHLEEYDKVLRIPETRAGYIRLNTNNPYENQEWAFIDLRISLAHIRFGQKEKSTEILNYINEQASKNNNTIPEMFSNKTQLNKVTDYFKTFDVWCNCIRTESDMYIATVPMVGFGAGTYILTILEYYKDSEKVGSK